MEIACYERMSEQKNIEGSDQNSKVEVKVKDEFMEETQPPAAGLPQQPQPENMEVHKHPHHVTHKKKWGEYLLEFLMIFLAVTLGFFAENMRETISDSHREKRFAQQLYSELKDYLAE